VAVKRVAAMFVAAHTLPENSPIKLEQKVALCAANKIGRPLLCGF